MTKVAGLSAASPRNPLPVPSGDALRQAYEQDYDKLVRLAGLMSATPSLREDHVQEAFARCLPHSDAIAHPSAYLRKAVVNICRSARRRRRIRFLSSETLEASEDFDDSSLLLWEALQTLTERRRTAVVLRFWSDLTTDEIAETMGCAPGTVSSLLHRALSDLRKELADDR